MLSDIYLMGTTGSPDVVHLESLLTQVDPERLYKHILKTEGEKHPLYSAEQMEACADYILNEFESYGLKTNVHEFKIEGFDYTFRNIEAHTNGDGPEFLVVSHYDTIRQTPGANDNGSAIAVMLEAARIISLIESTNAIRFISFNLEELNPSMAQNSIELELKHGIRDKDGRYTSWHTSQTMERFSKLFTELVTTSSSYSNAVGKVIAELDKDLTSSEREYLEGVQTLYEGTNSMNWPGRTALTGSSAWVRDALQRNHKIKGVLCLDTTGYTSDKKHSQQVPEGMSPEIFEIYGTDTDLLTGDFLFALRDLNSKNLAEQFCKQCRHELVQLPYACLQADLTYEQAAHGMRDILRSDHAPFWRENLPALLLADGANFRYPYYHTHADTIDKLDFDFLAKICRAVVATAVSF